MQTGDNFCTVKRLVGPPFYMFSQVPDLAWNGLIIRWLQVQVLPGPQHTDQEKRPKGAFYLGRQATRPTLLVLPSLAPFRAISRVLRPKRGPRLRAWRSASHEGKAAVALCGCHSTATATRHELAD